MYPSFSSTNVLRQPEKNIDVLLSKCEEVRPAFSEILTSIVEAAGLDPNKVITLKSKDVMHTSDTTHYTTLTVPPLKTKLRCMEKAETEYNGDISRLLDINRASIIVNKEKQLLAIAKALENQNIVRLQNRFKEPLFTGYRDALYSICINGVICEIQLHHRAIVVADDKKESYMYYTYFRSFFSGNVDAVSNRIGIIESCLDLSIINIDIPVMLEEILCSQDVWLVWNMYTLVNEMGDLFMSEVLCRCLVEMDPDYCGHKRNLAHVLLISDGQGEKNCAQEEAEMLYRECLEI
eukprot:14439452-Ditylum_brightwellii.AAC.1